MRRAQPLAERLQLIAAAGRQPQMAAFFGEGFGGGRTNALRCAGDQDALATQMQIHGIFSLDRETLEASARSSNCEAGTAEAVNIALHSCTGANFGPLQSRQNNRRFPERPVHKES